MEPENRSRSPSGRIAEIQEVVRRANALETEPYVPIEAYNRRTQVLLDRFKAKESPTKEEGEEFHRNMQNESKRLETPSQCRF